MRAPRAWAMGCAALLSSACLATPEDIGRTDQAVIYGTDSRTFTFNAAQSHVWESRSVAMLFIEGAPVTDLVSGGPCLEIDPQCKLPVVTFNALDLADTKPLCGPGSPAPVVGYGEPTSDYNYNSCTAFIVGPDLMATANHCIATAAECADATVVFGFDKPSAATVTPSTVPGSQVYYCQSVVAGEKVDNKDWTVFKVDRVIKDRPVLPVRRLSKAGVGTDVVLIGHPWGLPKMVAPDAKVVQNPNTATNVWSDEWFEANVDSFAGSSGSPVINALTGTVEGILVEGNTDWKKITPPGCWTENVCGATSCSPTDNDAEHVTSSYLVATRKPGLTEPVPLDPASTITLIY